MKKLALCIGNDDYEILPRLNCCIADATAIGEQLKNLGFDTILKTNLNRESLADEILGFVEQIRQYDAFCSITLGMASKQMEIIFWHQLI